MKADRGAGELGANPGRAFGEAALAGEVLALARGGIQLIGLDHGGRR